MSKARTKLVIGNWKLNGSKALAKTAKETLEGQDFGSAEVGLCPPLTLLADLQSDSFLAGAQDVSSNNSGAFTGEVSAEMLAEAGAKLVIVGHSERRTYHNESDALVAEKSQKAIEAGLTPVVCFGESESIRDANNYIEYCVNQVAVVLEALGTEQFGKCVLAYEPVWAIGTGKTASPEQAQEVHAEVRTFLAEKDQDLAASMKILYGGSVKGSNAAELFGQNDVDGGLIGGASLKPDEFVKICLAAK